MILSEIVDKVPRSRTIRISSGHERVSTRTTYTLLTIRIIKYRSIFCQFIYIRRMSICQSVAPVQLFIFVTFRILRIVEKRSFTLAPDEDHQPQCESHCTLLQHSTISKNSRILLSYSSKILSLSLSLSLIDCLCYNNIFFLCA